MAYFFLFLLLMMGSPRAAEQVKCYAWSEARPIISQNRLMSGKDIIRSIRSQYNGKSVQVNRLELCKQNARFVYLALIIDRGNKAIKIILDAKSGKRLDLRFGPGLSPYRADCPKGVREIQRTATSKNPEIGRSKDKIVKFCCYNRNGPTAPGYAIKPIWILPICIKNKG